MGKWDMIILKVSVLKKKLLIEKRNHLQYQRKSFPTLHLTEDWHPEHTKNSKNETSRKATQLKMVHGTDSPQNKKKKCLLNIFKSIQHSQLRIQIIIVLTFYPAPVRVDMILKKEWLLMPSRMRELLFIVGRSKLTQILWKSVRRFLQKLKQKHQIVLLLAHTRRILYRTAEIPILSFSY